MKCAMSLLSVLMAVENAKRCVKTIVCDLEMPKSEIVKRIKQQEKK
jgi:hypothetical protein